MARKEQAQHRQIQPHLPRSKMSSVQTNAYTNISERRLSR